MLKILVTGATGSVGQEVLSLLQSHDCNICAGVRNPNNAKHLLGNNIQCVPFDFTNPDTFDHAFF